MIIPLITNASIALISLYLFILFSIWWIIARKATAIFGFTCFLMLGISMHYTITTYLWWLELIQIDGADFIRENPLITINCFFIFIPLFFYSYYVTKKFFKAIWQHRLNKSTRSMLDD